MSAAVMACLHPLLPQGSARVFAAHGSFAVKAALLSFPLPGIAAFLADDPDPVVRFLAYRNGWDLPDQIRAALAQDPGVTKVTLVFSRETDSSG